MKIADKIVKNIIGKPRVRGGKNDLDGDGVPNKKDCQPRNTMRQDPTDPRYSIISDEDGYQMRKAEIDRKVRGY